MLDALPDDRRQFRHEALLYDGDRAFVDATTRFVAAGLDEGAPVLVATSAEKCAAVRHALGSEAARVSFLDMAEVGQNPARIIPVWRTFLDDAAHSSAPARGVGEPVWPERSADELRECQQHEALLNDAFLPGRAWWLLCPYDRSTLPESAIDAAFATHPHVCADGAHRASEGFDPLADPLDLPLSLPPARPAFEMAFDASQVHDARRRVVGLAAEIGLHPQRGEDLSIAVSEVASNSIRHGGGGGALSAWVTPEALVCEVRDTGHITDRLAGRLLPEPHEPDGRGLWIANQLCDLVQLSSNAGGSTVRLHVRRV